MLDPLIMKMISTVGTLCGTFLVQITISKLLSGYNKKIASKTKNKFDNEAIPLASRILGLITWIIGIVIVLINFGIDIKGLTATLGVGSIAIAMAVKDNVKDIISGVSLMTSKPFKPGDMIKLSSGEVVEVLEIGISDSRFLLRDEKDGILIIRNNTLNKAKILNYTLAKERKGEE